MSDPAMPPKIRRLYLSIWPGDPGRLKMSFAASPPAGGALGVLVTRGMLAGDGLDLELDIVSDPAADPTLRGPPGTPASTTQIAQDVAAWLTAHPPPAGKDGALGTAIGTITIAPTALIQVTAGLKQLAFDVAGLKVGDRIAVLPTVPVPNGIGLPKCVTVSAVDRLAFNAWLPVLVAGSAYPITAQLVRIA